MVAKPTLGIKPHLNQCRLNKRHLRVGTFRSHERAENAGRLPKSFQKHLLGNLDVAFPRLRPSCPARPGSHEDRRQGSGHPQTTSWRGQASKAKSLWICTCQPTPPQKKTEAKKRSFRSKRFLSSQKQLDRPTRAALRSSSWRARDPGPRTRPRVPGGFPRGKTTPC